jgi:hypothetical protein
MPITHIRWQPLVYAYLSTGKVMTWWFLILDAIVGGVDGVGITALKKAFLSRTLPHTPRLQK